MVASCNKSDCDRTWERDPCLEVACPTCGAGVGSRCRRPSGWSGPFVTWHKKRDLKALDEGHYGPCPSGRCPESLDDLGLTTTDPDTPEQVALTDYDETDR